MAFLGLEVDVGRALGDGLREHVGDEAHHGGILVRLDVGLRGLDGLRGLGVLVKAAGAHSVVLGDERGDAFGRGEVPHGTARREGGDPVGHVGIGRERRGEVQTALLRAGEADGDDLGFAGETRRQDLDAFRIGGGFVEDGQAGLVGQRLEQAGLVQPQPLGEQPEARVASGLLVGGPGLVGKARGEGRRKPVPMDDGRHGHFLAGGAGTAPGLRSMTSEKSLPTSP